MNGNELTHSVTNPCAVADCFNGECNNVNDEAVCTCFAGYSGDDCNQDINECADGSHQCIADATCNNTEGGYVCSCAKGYKGDGRSNGSACTGKLTQSSSRFFMVQDHLETY